MNSNKLKLSILTASILFTSTVSVCAETLDEIIVTSDFRDTTLNTTSKSITVLSEDQIYDKASQNLLETIANVPNVNFSSGASKAKYIQIRGIGERSQFETPINPSVGLILDGIDFSNATLGANLFDVKQVEILRGPQGTTFGSNALAGVITLKSNEPTKQTEGHIETTIGNYNTKAIGAVVGGSLIEDKLLGRISVYNNVSDGFMKNSYLNRTDTNNIDELNLKSQLKWLKSDDHTIDINLIHSNIKNGYDAFTFDNSRTSISDEPGKDTQRTNAISIKSTKTLENANLITSVSHSKSHMTYSYDEDWSNPTTQDGWTGTDEYIRTKQQSDIDLRLVSTKDITVFDKLSSWTLGTYFKEYNNDLIRNHTDNDQYRSDYTMKNSALYGQLDTKLSNKLTLISGLRLENIDLKHNDSDNFHVSSDETLVGGKIGVNYTKDQNHLYYATLSKGYKPGGVNATNSIPQDAREFKTETLFNLDIGANTNYFDNTLTSRLNLFYGKRYDQQVKSSYVENANNGGATFTEYFTNAAKGTYYGLESQLDYYYNDNLYLYSSLGLLKSKFDEYVDSNPRSTDVNGRDQAQSPRYQYSLGFSYAIDESFTFKSSVNGRGSYYFSNRHNYKAKSYKLLNSSFIYTKDNLTLTLWGKNLTDEDYQTRGFGTFGNNPANGWATELYTQQGDPRTFGFTLGYDF